MPTDKKRPNSAANADSFQTTLQRACDGDADAWLVLVQQHSPGILRTIRGQFLRPGSPLQGGLDPDDLLQDSWLIVFRQLQTGKTFLSAAHFQRFVVTVVRNEFRQCYRRRVNTDKRAAGREVPLGRDGDEPAWPRRDWADEAGSVEECARLLAGLSRRDSRVLSARADNVPQAALAKEFGVSVRTVKRQLQHARMAARHGGGMIGARAFSVAVTLRVTCPCL